MQSTSIHVLFEKLTNLGVTLGVEDGKLEWETILPLPGSLLDELIARQAEFVSMINGVPYEKPVCLMPRPLLGGDRIPSDEVAVFITLLEELGTTIQLSSTGVYSTSSKPLPPKVIELLHKHTDDICKYLWTKENNNRRRN